LRKEKETGNGGADSRYITKKRRGEKKMGGKKQKWKRI
jgi:hypothetical protein